MRRAISAAVVPALALVFSACTGGIGSSGDDDDPGTASPSSPTKPGSSTGVSTTGVDPARGAGPSQPAPDTGGPAPSTPPPALDSNVAPAHARRLTRLEYNNTIRDLLSDPSRPADAFASDTDADGTGFARGGAVSAVDADQLMEAAEKIGAAAVKRLPSLLPCNAIPTAAADQDRCARDFIARFGRRAFRRPLAAAETEALTAYYTKVRTDLGLGFADGIRMVIQVMVQSPALLYRWELGPARAIKEGALVRFNDHEIASRLSYALWASMPDDTLFAAADAGGLRTAADVEKQARRMLADPKSRDMLGDFQTQWLRLASLATATKDPKVYPTFTRELAASMDAESREMIAFVLGKGDGKLDTLLTAPFSFVDANLAKLYGVAGVTGTALRMTQLDATRRGGVLTGGAFLTAHAAPGGSHPVQRGKEIAERVLCIELPIPPANIPELPPPAANVSTRERFAVHGKAECARACHDIIDPLGFAFEHYDGVGAYRTTDGGKPVDASGSYTLGGAPKAFANAIDLGKHLAAAPETRDCAVRQLVRYALRRREVAGDASSLAFVADRFAKSGHDLRELLVAVTTSRAFFYRQPSAGEVLQ